MKNLKLTTFLVFLSIFVGCNSEVAIDTLGDKNIAPTQTESQPENNIVENNYACSGIDPNANITPVTRKLVAGQSTSCLLLDSGDVKCWGANNSGQLGLGHEDNMGDDETSGSFSTVALGGGVVTEIFGDSKHSCALMNTGHIRCWGWGSSYQTGHRTLAVPSISQDVGDDELPSAFNEINFGGGLTVVKVSPARWNTCVLLSDDNVKCWGRGYDGANGSGSTGTQSYYESAPNMDLNLGGAKVVDLAPGGYHHCALLDTGDVKCWGGSSDGPGILGYASSNSIGDNEDTSALPIIDLGGDKVSQITGSNTITCVVLVNGKARCFGANESGQLGLGHTNNIGDDETPGSVPYIPIDGTVVQIAPGNHHVCALLSTGAVTCWGSGTKRGAVSSENIGDDEAIDNNQVQLCEPAVSINSGYHHTCALLQSGKVTCWGSGGSGALGYGNTNTVGDDEHPFEAGTLSL